MVKIAALLEQQTALPLLERRFDHALRRLTGPRSGLSRLYYLASRLLPYVPPRLGYALCERLSIFAPLLPVWGQILENLRYVLPKAPAASLRHHARQVVANLLKNYYELLRLHAVSAAELDRIVEVRGLENLLDALEQGKGLLVAMPHIGNLSLVAEPVAARAGQPILVVVEHMRDPGLHELLNNLRRRRNVEVVELGPSAVRAVLAGLRANKIVVLATDRAVAGATVDLEFFGRPARVPSGPATLALRTGAPLLTAYTYRRPDNCSVVVVDPPLRLERDGNLREQVYHTMQAIMRIFESYIRRRPSQWLITEPIWKTV